MLGSTGAMASSASRESLRMVLVSHMRSKGCSWAATCARPMSWFAITDRGLLQATSGFWQTRTMTAVAPRSVPGTIGYPHILEVSEEGAVLGYTLSSELVRLRTSPTSKSPDFAGYR